MQLQKPAATGNALLSYKVLRFTDRMDVKGTIGVNWTWNPRSSRSLNVVHPQSTRIPKCSHVGPKLCAFVGYFIHT
jgi:hypothetical protein